MWPGNEHEIKEVISERLEEIYGSREAMNIATYYIDAMRGTDITDFDKDLEKLESGIPVQYVCQSAYFYGTWFYVDQNVLIPRPETEELVHWILSESSYSIPYRILDIGSGSGCIILSLLNKLKLASGTAMEIDEQAYRIIRGNADSMGVSLEVLQSDILRKDLPEETFYDIIVSNPPYILQEEKYRMDDVVVHHEPEKALFVEGDDPLVFYKKIIEVAEKHCDLGGCLYMETSDLYHQDLKSILDEKKYKYEFRKDLQDNWRMLKVVFF